MEVKSFNLKGNKKVILILLTLTIILCVGAVSATENVDSELLKVNSTTHSSTMVKTTTNDGTGSGSSEINENQASDDLKDTSNENNPITSPDTSTETNGSEESNNNASENEEVSSEIDLENAIILTKDNYQDMHDIFDDDLFIVINDTLENLSLEIYAQNITITGINNPVLYNSHINVVEGNLHLSNVTFLTDDNSQYPQTVFMETDDNLIENVIFNDYRKGRDAGSEIHYRCINVYGNNNTVRNCTFNVTYRGMNINWATSVLAECQSQALVFHGNYNSLLESRFNIKEAELEYPGLTGQALRTAKYNNRFIEGKSVSL